MCFMKAEPDVDKFQIIENLKLTLSGRYIFYIYFNIFK